MTPSLGGSTPILRLESMIRMESDRHPYEQSFLVRHVCNFL